MTEQRDLRWDDRSAIRILATCREAMGDAGRLPAIELVAPSTGGSPDVEWLVKATDLEMLPDVDGRERTAPEYRELYAASGFELMRILPLRDSAWGTAIRGA